MKRYGPFLLAGAGVLLMLAGVYRQEVNVLYENAIRICLECIGIG